MEVRSERGQLCPLCIDERAQAVYWHNAPACNESGPDHALCLLVETHAGRHEGNGYDDVGSVYRCWR